MKHFFRYSLLCILSLPLFTAAQKVISITIDGTINPVSADFIHNSIDKASREKAEGLIIHLNTPGGLLQSTRSIVSDILESPVPVIVYVSPGGAHAGSAGVFLVLAAHVAAMAPGTNIGAAHPVTMQGEVDSVMNEKITNDAAAFIRSIAQKRNRNIDWAERAVRRSYSYSETEALQDSVIDLIAVNDADLLQKLNGKLIELTAGNKHFLIKEPTIEIYRMSIWEKLLNVLSDPTIAYILLMIGMYGIMFELFSPGAILPGIAGVIALILAFYSMQTLPVNYAGLALIIFGIILFILEIKVVSHGLLAIGGTVSLFLGSIMLIRPGSSIELAAISRAVIYSATVLTTLFFLFIIGAGLRAQRRKVLTGPEGMKDTTGEVIEMLDPTGMIKLNGELWAAESISGTINKGERVKVTGRKSLKLFVETLRIGDADS
jgi:membrane-bound serine protease (ClpP class)